jgi:DNA polymerase-3 subunit alpha
MLEVLPHAQASGQKAQQDAQLGQGSIFDLDEGAGGGPAEPAASHNHRPVPPLPDVREELMAMERETLGLFLSSHPLKEVRAPLRARADCSLADLGARKDGEWLTVGGMIADFKRIRTKRGDEMMFATLDDLEGQVEMLVMGNVYASAKEWVEAGKVVLARGRLDHQDRGVTKLILQELNPFEPSAEEIESARQNGGEPAPNPRLVLSVEPGVPETFLDELKEVVSHFPGQHELMLRIGERTLVLGSDYRVSGTSACRADLAGLPGALAA